MLKRKCKKCGVVFSQEHTKYVRKFCSRKCANSRKWSFVHNKKLSEKMKGYQYGFCKIREEHENRICPICKNIFDIIKKYKQIFCSNKCRYIDYKNGFKYQSKNRGGYRENSTIKHKSIYKGFILDSGSELEFAKLLDKNKIKWVKNTSKYFNYTYEGVLKKYYPDFYLPDYDYWVEIKGRYYSHPADIEKLKSVGSNIELQYHDEIRIPNICRKL